MSRHFVHSRGVVMPMDVACRNPDAAGATPSSGHRRVLAQGTSDPTSAFAGEDRYAS